MGRRAKQFTFNDPSFRSLDCFGGSFLKGNARSSRPIDSKLPLHLILTADVSANRSMRHPQSFLVVNAAVEDIAKKYGVKIFDYANVGSHLHLLIQVGNRRLWARFIRELTGRIAQLVQGLRGRAKGKRFWTHKPWTRVVKGWRKAFKAAKDYVMLNRWEGDGNISRNDWKSLREMREGFVKVYGFDCT